MSVKKNFFALMIFGLFLLFFSPQGEAVIAKKPIKIAFTSVVIKENLELQDILIKYLSGKLQREVIPVYRKTYKEIDTLLEKREIDLAWICGASYVVGRNQFGLELLAVPQVIGYKEGKYRAYVITLAENEIISFRELRGRTFAFADPISFSGKIVPAYMLAKMEETPDAFFKKYIYTYSHYESIQAVAEGFVEGASVDSYVYDTAVRFNPELVSKTRVIDRSDWYGFPPIVIRRGIGKEIKTGVQKVLAEMKDDPEGKKVLKKFGLEGFMIHSPDLYDGIRNMIDFMGRFDEEKGER